VLLLGAGGMLGTELAALAPSNVRLLAVRRTEVDVTDAPAVAAAFDTRRPECVINAAAYTRVDDAESDSDRAFAVNAAAVGALGRACAKRGIGVVHFSTDYVFRGDARRPYRENDQVDPVNTYGRTKLAGEEALRLSGARALILRTQWLFGRHGKSFPRTIWGRAQQRLPTRVVDDQFGSPTYTVDLARATWELVRMGTDGLFHVANRGEATWLDVARRVFAAAGAEECLQRCSTAEYPTPAKRPSYSVLDTSKLESERGLRLPAWTDAIDRFLEVLSEEDRPVGSHSGLTR
jgi:dTDP-4-dehydrorhamnose reductase